MLCIFNYYYFIGLIIRYISSLLQYPTYPTSFPQDASDFTNQSSLLSYSDKIIRTVSLNGLIHTLSISFLKLPAQQFHPVCFLYTSLVRFISLFFFSIFQLKSEFPRKELSNTCNNVHHFNRK